MLQNSQLCSKPHYFSLIQASNIEHHPKYPWKIRFGMYLLFCMHVLVIRYSLSSWGGAGGGVERGGLTQCDHSADGSNHNARFSLKIKALLIPAKYTSK